MGISKTIRIILALLFILAGAAVLTDGIMSASVIEGICGVLFVALGIAELLPASLPGREKSGQEVSDADDAQRGRKNRGLQYALGALLCAAGAISLYIGITGGRWASLLAGVLFIASAIIHFITAHNDARG